MLYFDFIMAIFSLALLVYMIWNIDDVDNIIEDMASILLVLVGFATFSISFYIEIILRTI